MTVEADLKTVLAQSLGDTVDIFTEAENATEGTNPVIYIGLLSTQPIYVLGGIAGWDSEISIEVNARTDADRKRIASALWNARNAIGQESYMDSLENSRDEATGSTHPYISEGIYFASTNDDPRI